MPSLSSRWRIVPALALASNGHAIILDSRPDFPGVGASIRAHVELLASDGLNGRGSATRDEQIAAEYVAVIYGVSDWQPRTAPAPSCTRSISSERGQPNVTGAVLRLEALQARSSDHTREML